MGIKNSRHKIQSSLGMFSFVLFELPYMKTLVGLKDLSLLPTIRNEKEYEQMIVAVQLAVLAYHTEIMRQAFKEYIDTLGNNHPYSKYLNELGFFLSDLRHAFNHTKQELIPRWDAKVKTKSPFIIKVPVDETKEGKCFSAKSKNFFNIIWYRIKPNLRIKVTHDLFYKIYLLSHHVLEIVKKKNNTTLTKYINPILLAK